MRGKVVAHCVRQNAVRITPAYAGKRNCGRQSRCSTSDHPRVCGEKELRQAIAVQHIGSPPHVRGKAGYWVKDAQGRGITPACAGKRKRKTGLRRQAKDHPRMCGEKRHTFVSIESGVGSPPHVRGKGPLHLLRCRVKGITPACAGKRLKRSRSTVPPVAIVPLFPSVCNKPVASDGSPAGRDAPLFLPAENAVPASPAYNLRSL